MSDGLQCPVCEEEIPYEDEDGKRSLSQLLGAGISTAVADHTEAQLREHLGTHSVEDFVTALVMADRYIAIVESERDEAVGWRKDVEARIQARPAPVVAPRPDYPAGPGDFQPPPPIGRDGSLAVYPQPGPRRQYVDPDRTLIPVISTGSRPEGVVGRKTG